MEKLNIKSLTPLHNYVIVTSDRYTVDDATSAAGLVDTSIMNEIKYYQKIVSISERIIDRCPFKVGDLVLVSFKAYLRKRQVKDSVKSDYDEHYRNDVYFEIPTVTIDGVEYLKLGDNDIEFVVNEYEIIQEAPEPVSPLIGIDKDPKLIIDKPKIILN